MTNEQLLNLFKTTYNTSDWKQLLLELFPNSEYFIKPEEHEITASKQKDAKSIICFGKVVLDDKSIIRFFEVELKDGKKITRNRVGLRNLVTMNLVPGDTDGIIVTYFHLKSHEWRMSFISKSAYWDEDNKLVKEETLPRRYTYVLGANESHKTVLSRFNDLIRASATGIQIGDLLRAFSVEKISNEFFNQYRDIYENFCEFLDDSANRKLFTPTDTSLTAEEKKKETERAISNYSKKLMGRIVFLYFLQKKGWMGVPEGKKWGDGFPDFMTRLFKSFDDKQHFYERCLTILFFKTLNLKRENDIFEVPIIIDDLKNKGPVMVPFLNGGLFDEVYGEPKNIRFKPELFESLFSFFDEYNFTVDENTPDDHDIGVDPEMLGLIFENLLEDNKDKGTYYTPKEVVHFMCLDSISLYIQQQLKSKLDEKNLHLIDKFIKRTIEDTPAIIKVEADEILKALNRVKICDPAIGSGAFPMGMVQEILRLKRELAPHLSKHKSFDYQKEKLSIIKNNIYGVDIDKGAVDISRLRFWLSLIVEEDEPKPLPNLDYKIMQGNSLLESFEEIELSEVKHKPRVVKDVDLFGKIKNAQISINDKQLDFDLIEKLVEEFFAINNSDEKKAKHKEIDDLVIAHIEERIEAERLRILDTIHKLKELLSRKLTSHKITKAQTEKIRTTSSEAKNIEKKEKELVELDAKFEKMKALQNVEERPYFLWHLFFKDVFDANGFDIVIGNPPYGVSVTESIRDKYKLNSKDSYGVFMSMALQKLLKPNAILSYIVSDTWLTIKSHKAIREQILQHDLKKVIRLHQDCFKATVNSCIFTVIKTTTNGVSNNLLAADLTNISTRKEVPEFREKIFNLEENIGQSTFKFAVYEYPQNLIYTNTSIPVFVASPKLFALMNDTNCITYQISKTATEKTSEEDNTTEETGMVLEADLGSLYGNSQQTADSDIINVRQIELNNKIVEIVKFNDVATIKKGIDTGKNENFLFQDINARGNYRDIETLKNFIIPDEDLLRIDSDRELHEKIIKFGFLKSKNKKLDTDLFFNGKYIVPYEKGGESDAESGWLPNYYVKNAYYIDWSSDSVTLLYNASKNKVNTSTLRNKKYWFKPGLTFSLTGIYAPTIRVKSPSLFDNKSSGIFTEVEIEIALGILSSKIAKYIFKNYIMHTVDTQVGAFEEFPFRNITNNESIREKVNSIILQQKINPRYDYQSNEQKEIDKLVYELYGLNQQDINEVENWFARRYPKMADYAYITEISIEEETTTTDENNILETIAQGENKHTEFKSTLRWDIKQGSVQKHIEHSILKTLAAFMNSEGGTLFIGVNDEGNLLGLENDYNSFGNKANKKDEFSKYLDNIIKNHLGDSVHALLSITFPVIQEKQLCVIKVNNSSEEVYLKADSKEEFYIRRTASSIALTTREAVAYIKENWK